ncbi:hypothetical protein LguiB_017659 [Lonicera macranthoides]
MDSAYGLRPPVTKSEGNMTADNAKKLLISSTKLREIKKSTIRKAKIIQEKLGWSDGEMVAKFTIGLEFDPFRILALLNYRTELKRAFNQAKLE